MAYRDFKMDDLNKKFGIQVITGFSSLFLNEKGEYRSDIHLFSLQCRRQDGTN